MKILLDAMGGDNAPDATIKGAVNAINGIKAEVVLIGKQEIIENKVKEFYGKSLAEISPRLSIKNATETIEMEDGGVMKGELYPEIAPITVENFLNLIDQDFFAGLIFHRVIPGFMIQGGGYDKEFNHHEAKSIKGEFSSNGVKNDLLHTRGVLSMARTMIPDSASSQNFIMHEDAPHLDGQYAAFGKITDGLEIVFVEKMEQVLENALVEQEQK